MEGTKKKMRIAAIINLKGGVGKTITSINSAYVLSEMGHRVLVVDNDKQGNTSKFFGVHSYERASLADIMAKGASAADVIRKTEFKGIDVIPANMELLTANKAVLLDTTKPQQVRIKAALEAVQGDYDFCIIDCAPDINMSVINALTAADEFIIPIKIDNFTLDGVKEIMSQAEEIKKYFNPALTYRGGLITSYRNNEVNIQGREYLRSQTQYKIFDTVIRWTAKVDESTFAALPILKHSSRCGAARDYKMFVKEWLGLE